MKNDTYLGIILLATFAPIIFFGLVALFTKPSLRTHSSYEDAYMLAGRGIKPADFINSATGYMLQVSTTFYFIYWGYNYGFSNIFYLLSWAGGITLFASFAPQLLIFRTFYKSLPEMLSEGNRNNGRLFAAIASVISFIGVFYVESYFTTDFITNIALVQADDVTNNIVWWVIFSSLIILVLLYSISGGLKKVVVTDIWQLACAYLGLAIIFYYLLHLTFLVNPFTGAVLCALCIIIYFCLLIAGRNTNEGLIKPASLIIGIILFIYSMIDGLSNTSLNVFFLDIHGLFKQITEPWGWFTLLGFTLINIVWQFCDNSNYQRIGALKLSDDSKTAENEIKTAIRKLILVSPLTWGLGIIFGMLIKSAGTTVSAPGSEYQAVVVLLKNAALSGDFLALFVLFSLIASLISIMMSTCDTALIAAIQVSHKDLQNKLPFNNYFLAFSALIFLLLVASLAYVHKITGNTSILTVMAGAYSAILVLFPLSFYVSLGKKVTSRQMTLTICIGLAANFYATFLAPTNLPFNVSIVLPIFMGLGGSTIGFFLFYKNNKENQ